MRPLTSIRQTISPSWTIGAATPKRCDNDERSHEPFHEKALRGIGRRIWCKPDQQSRMEKRRDLRPGRAGSSGMK
jgi:hypothetical protein